MRLLWCAVLAAATLCAQEDPLAWFPLQVGSRWTYDHEWISGDRNRPDVDRWTTVETITRWVTIPEGLLVLREAQPQSHATQPAVNREVVAPNGERRYVQGPIHAHGDLAARAGQPYLLQRNCVYGVGAGWDSQKQELRSEFREYLKQGALSPDFCFPLRAGQAWGNKDIPWSVEPPRPGLGAFLPATYAGAVHIFSSHYGSGGWDDVWFQKGVGVVGEHYIHNGTYDEYTKTLRSYSR